MHRVATEVGGLDLERRLQNIKQSPETVKRIERERSWVKPEREERTFYSSPRSWKDRGANEAHRCRQRVVARLLRANVAQVHLRLVGEPAV